MNLFCLETRTHYYVVWQSSNVRVGHTWHCLVFVYVNKSHQYHQFLIKAGYQTNGNLQNVKSERLRHLFFTKIYSLRHCVISRCCWKQDLQCSYQLVFMTLPVFTHDQLPAPCIKNQIGGLWNNAEYQEYYYNKFQVNNNYNSQIWQYL